MLWIAVRAGQILFAVILAKMAYLARATDVFVEQVISSVGLLLFAWLFVPRLVTGFANLGGVHCRRYFRWKKLAWSDVQEIQWKGAKIRVFVRDKKKPKAVLEFLLNPLKWKAAYWKHRWGADVEPPETLRRLQAFPMDAPPPMSSAPPISRWILRFFVTIWALFALVMLWRLFSATAH
jgi:hypothetical protein